MSLHALAGFLKETSYSDLMIVMDGNTERDCYPLLESYLPAHHTFVFAAGEKNKNIDSCQQLWEYLSAKHFDRHALIINLGGGVVGDMGGFAAAVYKRGIRFVQIPTTLLSMVDASVGGKLGIDFLGYKNQIGLFSEPESVFIWPQFLKTLPHRELVSGFAEIVKHCLIADVERWQLLKKTDAIADLDFQDWITHSVKIKSKIVADDPKERGIRKALNFGHTIGHAVERMGLERAEPILHGEAVAAGMLCEAWISYQRGLISTEELESISDFILLFFPKLNLNPQETAKILSNLDQDKKNKSGKILCSLLQGVGNCIIDEEISKQDVSNALLFYSDLLKR